MLDILHYSLAAGSGALVGLALGLVGGGGSILAVPLMLYVVGVRNPHVAIGTSALAVAASAGTGLLNHSRSGTVKWRCAGMYAAAGVAGALAGSTAGKAFDGQKLLFLFAIVMMIIGVMMLRSRGGSGNPDAECNRENAVKVVGYGFGTGVLSGFFGIGGGFLIVPGLVGSTGMPMINAIGSSLVAVTAFGLTTALNYALSGLVDWAVALMFVTGGVFGGFVGVRLAKHLSQTRGILTSIFAVLIFTVACYMLWRSAAAFGLMNYCF